METLSIEYYHILVNINLILVFTLGIFNLHLQKKLKYIATNAQSDVEHFNKGLNNKQAEINRLNIEVSTLTRNVKMSLELLNAREFEIAELESEVKSLKFGEY
jgi:peptidoglycan hydrolase CwlO-like protein